MPRNPFTGAIQPWTTLTERSPHGPRPITISADGERVDHNLPYYVRSKEGRNKRAYTVKMCDAVGTHLICPRQTCRRAGACSDRDLTKLPFCAHRFRETIRHAICLAEEHFGLHGRAARAAPGRDFDKAPPPQPFTGKPLIQRLLDAGAPREVLERPTGVAETDWDCESEPAARANMAEVRRARLAREVAAGTGDPAELRKAETEAARLAELAVWRGEGPPPWRGPRGPRSATSYPKKTHWPPS
jgi:hypothetical protein